MSIVEIEGKVLDIDVSRLRAELVRRGSPLGPRTLMRRHVYDVIPARDSAWIRLRHDGARATIAVKDMGSEDALDSAHEIEVEVSDFDSAHAMLEQCGHRSRGYQENYRQSGSFQGSSISIDEWPHLPPYLEIEGESPDQVRSVCAELGFDPETLVTLNTISLYAKIGINLRQIPNLTFP